MPRLSRRCAIAAAVASAVMGARATAHTPYGQWTTYRRKHLLVGCHRADLRTYELAQALVENLDDHLPEAQARVARAPDARRLASLLGTDQLQMALLRASDAAAMAAGAGEFQPYGRIPLTGLARVQDRCLVAHESMPAHHAWLLARALGAAWDGDCARRGMAAHPGANAWRRGLPLPGSGDGAM